MRGVERRTFCSSSIGRRRRRLAKREGAGSAFFLLSHLFLQPRPLLSSLSPKLNKKKQVVKLKSFCKFDTTTDALAAATALVDSKMSKSLKKFLKKHADGDSLGVADAKLGAVIKEKLGIACVASGAVSELSRGIRAQLGGLVSGLAGGEGGDVASGSDDALAPMALGLAHSLSRYKLKFSPDQVDTMVVQAIGLLDDLDKELNTYAMRAREWCVWRFFLVLFWVFLLLRGGALADFCARARRREGEKKRNEQLTLPSLSPSFLPSFLFFNRYGWHFPEMAKVVSDNVAYAKCVRLMGSREAAAATDFSGVPLDEDVESRLREAAAVSMGTEISETDLANVAALCDQVVALSEYRAQLFDYLRARMAAIAPNLTALVGELVGARLVAHAGSLLSLAKAPASTVQILGAEKALFRALKTKHDTPKYGLIYHASLIGQAPPKLKGKISRLLAAKCSLGVRVDALGDGTDATVGLDARAKVRRRVFFFGF